MARRFTRPLCTIPSVHQIKRSRAPQKPQGREARRSCTLDGEDRTVQSRVQGKGGMARVAAAEPPSIRALASLILFPQG